MAPHLDVVVRGSARSRSATTWTRSPRSARCAACSSATCGPRADLTDEQRRRVLITGLRALDERAPRTWRCANAIRTVTAHAFGPLVGADASTLADGLTVVHGPNESAKSSWHAAIYAGLCGRRRGRRPTARATRRSRPATGRGTGTTGWSAREIVLDDGRRVELRQDLAGRVDCRRHRPRPRHATCSAEIINDGTPDASRWLGLDRRSFAATACVAQASMLAVLKRPGRPAGAPAAGRRPPAPTDRAGRAGPDRGFQPDAVGSEQRT